MYAWIALGLAFLFFGGAIYFFIYRLPMSGVGLLTMSFLCVGGFIIIRNINNSGKVAKLTSSESSLPTESSL